jgi:crossover junction endodeoxyribonuclease RusA
MTDSRLSITLPWPPKELSPNFRTRSTRWIARKKKEYRTACAEAAWQRGVQPGRGLRLDRLVFHAPDARGRDDDNTVARFKAGRDGLAEAMGVDDQEFNAVTPEFGAPVSGGAVIALLTEIPG